MIWRGVLFFACMIASLGCAARPANDVRANLAVMTRERKADKLLDRGKGFAAVGDYTRAEQYLSLALEAGADVATTLPLLMRVCVEGERYLAALEYARTYLTKNPEDVELRFLAASLEAAVGDPKVALENLREVTREKPDHADAHYALASLVKDGHGDLEEADRHFREYLRLMPEGPHAGEARASLLKAVP